MPLIYDPFSAERQRGQRILGISLLRRRFEQRQATLPATTRQNAVAQTLAYRRMAESRDTERERTFVIGRTGSVVWPGCGHGAAHGGPNTVPKYRHGPPFESAIAVNGSRYTEELAIQLDLRR